MLSSTIQSAEVNHVLTRILFPVLKEKGFSVHKGRRCWAYHDDHIWVVDIKSVGRYFSDVTGWPSSSLVVSLGILYMFYPISSQCKIDKNGLLYPYEGLCHRRSSLLTESPCILQESLGNKAERVRRDIWWIDRSNLNDTIQSIRDTFIHQGLSWLIAHSNKAEADSAIGNGKQLLELENEEVLINYPPPYL